MFADADIVVVDKPAGMPSVPARNAFDPPCVAAMLRDAYGSLEAVHRLDRDTSGLLVLARSPASRAALGQAFETREVRKRYDAIVEGVPSTITGEIQLPIGPDPWRQPRYRIDPITGRIAITRWRVVDCGEVAGQPRSRLELEPVTGRSHQLRVHLAWLGVPIVGDGLYGRSKRQPSAGRLALHAAWLRFPHPADGVPVEIESASGFRVDVAL